VAQDGFQPPAPPSPRYAEEDQDRSLPCLCLLPGAAEQNPGSLRSTLRAGGALRDAPGKGGDYDAESDLAPAHCGYSIECSATRLPSLSRMMARKPCGAMDWRGFKTFPPLGSTAAIASSSRPSTLK